jgi:TonB-linked SusC/RagA family outer membrane protein
VDYARSFGKHDITGLLLYNVQQTRHPGLQYHVPANLIGTAGRFTYKYDDRYLAEFNMGYNGSENFPPGKRFGFFPAFSLGWILTNEKFFPQNSFLSWAKLRGSYGEVGNDAIGGERFMYLPSAWGTRSSSPGDGYYFGTTDGTYTSPYYSGANESKLGNPNVTWERAKKANIGLDLNFFRNRLTFVGDLFQEKRGNILWQMGTVPSLVGVDFPPANIGRVSNKGYEIQLNWMDKIRDFSYGAGFNISYAQNKIEYKDEPLYSYEWMNETGFSLGQYKGWRVDGFYNNDQEASNRPHVSRDGNKVQAGDIRYVDINGDGIIDSQDQVPIGYSNLPRYAFGATLNIGYKGFYASILFSGTYKGSMRMSSFYVLNPFYMVNGAAMEFQYEGRWTPDKAAKGVEATFPRASIRTFDSQNGAMNDLWLRSSEHIKLKNMEIGYRFTNLRWLKPAGISGILLFANGNNLYTWGSKLIDGWDPEQEDSGGAADGYLYPPTRTYNFGINVEF